MKHCMTKESEQNAAILSRFYPIVISSPSTTNKGSTIPFMEGSELTKRLMMNRQMPPGPRNSQQSQPGDDNRNTEQNQHGATNPTAAAAAAAAGTATAVASIANNASLSAGQAATSTTGGTAAMAQHHHQHFSPPADSSTAMDDTVEQEKLNRRRKDFPWKLHCMLDEADIFHNTHIVSWMPDGRSFRVFRPDIFVTHIMPHYFHQTQYRSFQRMLNLYEFTKVLTGPNRGAYSHPSFLRSNRDLCLQMRIRKRNTTSTKRKKAPEASGGASKKSSETSTAAGARDSHGSVDIQQGGEQQDPSNPPPLYGRGSLGLSSRETMEGLLPTFQQPNSNPLQLQSFFQYSDLQRQQLQLQQSQGQPYEQRSSFEQQQYDDSNLSPLMSRQIHVLQQQYYPTAAAAAAVAAPSAPNLTTINELSNRNVLTSNWDAATYPRSLMAATPTTDEQRVIRSPKDGMDDLMRSRGGHTQYGNSMTDAKSPDSKSDNNSGHDVKASGTEQRALGEGGQQEQEAKQEPLSQSSRPLPFHMPLHMDLEPTPLPPSYQKRKHDDNK